MGKIEPRYEPQVLVRVFMLGQPILGLPTS